MKNEKGRPETTETIQKRRREPKSGAVEVFVPFDGGLCSRLNISINIYKFNNSKLFDGKLSLSNVPTGSGRKKSS